MRVTARAPLRLGLAGGGTDLSPFCDLYGGHVLNVTIGLYAYTIIEPLPDDVVELRATDIGVDELLPAVPILSAAPPLPLHKAAYNRIIRDYNHGKPFPCRITTFCDAVPGSGLGSSSAMVVSMVQAFVELFRLPLGEYDVARLSYQIEREDCGLSGGRQDQYAATFGGFNFMEFHADDRVIINPLRVKSWIISELEASLLLFFTGVSRESANIIDEQTANVRANNHASVEAMLEVKEDAVAMKEAILRGDLEAISGVLAKSWVAKKRMAKSISNDRIDGIYDFAMAAGAKAGKVSGAGGGGFFLFMVDPSQRIQVGRRLAELDGTVSGCHLTHLGSQAWRVD